MTRLAAVLWLAALAVAAPAAAQLTLSAPPQEQSPFLAPGSLAETRGIDPRRDEPFIRRGPGDTGGRPAILPRGLVIADPGENQGQRRGDAPGLGAIITLD